jgi:hypothetical protein
MTTLATWLVTLATPGELDLNREYWHSDSVADARGWASPAHYRTYLLKAVAYVLAGVTGNLAHAAKYRCEHHDYTNPFRGGGVW